MNDQPTHILDRLAKRIAAEPALSDIETLFVDLGDAHQAIVDANNQVLDLQNEIESLKNETAAASAPITAPPVTMAIKAPNVSEVETLLRDAKERLALNALSDVGYRIDSAIKLLE
jgi:hypothetical protein